MNAIPTVLRGFKTYLQTPPKITCLAWADANRYLSPEASAIRGKYYSAKAPYQREPQAFVNHPETASLCLKWASQLGKTEIICNIVGFFIDVEPAPILLVQPTTDLAESWSKERLNPMLRDTPRLRDKVSEARSRDSGNTVLHKTFPGGNIAMVGANAPAGLAGRPRRVILLDEIDRYPASAGTEGDPCALAERRSETFHNAVIVKTSTPTVRGSSRIDHEYEQSDQRQWWCPCPRCGTHQLLQWSQVRWPKDQPEAAWYECEKCEAHLSDKERVAMVRAGEWRALYPRRKARGYHLNGIACVFRARRGFVNRLHQMAAEFLKAKAGGVQTMRVWTNTFLAESYIEDAERVVASEIQKRAVDYGCEVPDGVLLLTGAVDVQGDRLVYEVVGWGAGEESWGIEYRTIPGRPDDARTWEKLDAALQRRWTRADGKSMHLQAVGVDCGNWKDYVLKWTRTRFARGILAVQGSNKAPDPIVSKISRSNRYKAAVLRVGTDQAKSLIYSRLKLTGDEPGQLHFPGVAQGYDAEFYAELTAEELRITFKRGFAVREWHRTRPRNEALDVRVYGLAMVRWLNPEWAKVIRSQKPVEIPADPAKSGTIDPDPGPVSRENIPQKAAKKRSIVGRKPLIRNFVSGWRRY